MGVRCVYDSANGTAAMYDSVSGFAFGPLFDDNEVSGIPADDLIAEFVRWCGDDDPRSMSDGDLEQHAIQFVRGVEERARVEQNASFS